MRACTKGTQCRIATVEGVLESMERARIRSLRQQPINKASLLGSEGYEKYAAACRETNPERAPGVERPRLPLQEMGEKPQNHGMFALILS